MDPKFKLQAPSKKVLIFGGTIVVFFLVFFSFGPLLKAYKNGDLNGSLSYSSNLGQNDQIDSDNDGLPDWQEKLWKTDPHNPDSDGDGTLDGEEVAEDRDPTKPGPDDQFTSLIQATALADSASYLNDPNNLSQQLAQTLFTQVVTSQSNGDIDEQSQEAIVNNSLAAFQPDVLETRYTISDVKTLDTVNKDAIKAFGNNFVSIQNQIDNTLNTETTNDQTVETYSNLVNQLVALKVPPDLTGEYLTLINNYDGLTQLLTLISADSDDPVKALVDVQSYEAITEKNQTIYTDFGAYFKKNGIIWTNTDPGNVWNNV